VKERASLFCAAQLSIYMWKEFFGEGDSVEASLNYLKEDNLL